MTWPFVRIPDFDANVQDPFGLSIFELIGFSPIIPLQLLSEWNNYTEAVSNTKEKGNGRAPDFQRTRGMMGEMKKFDDAKRMQNTDAARSLPKSNFSSTPKSSASLVCFVPIWQASSTLTSIFVGWNLANDLSFQRATVEVNQVRKTRLSSSTNLSTFLTKANEPRLWMVNPVFETTDSRNNASIVGLTWSVLAWENVFRDVLPEGTGRIVVEVSDSCRSKQLMYAIDGNNASFFGYGRYYGTVRSYREVSITSNDFASFGVNVEVLQNKSIASACIYTLTVFPTVEFEQAYQTNLHVVFTASILAVFFFTGFAFLVFDWLVRHRNEKGTTRAKRTTAVVASLFPESVQKRVLEEAEQAAEEANPSFTLMSPKFELKQLLGSDHNKRKNYNGKPIADFFTDTTIMFADIVGFTAWSSMREPTQVFTLLESIYQQFDEIALRRCVFKVETVGDCYVAVCGLPDPRKEHATVMARFATDCLHKFIEWTKRLEVELGPDTGELGLRLGLHSGPVTAGVLRGERARFQLFGDTVNTTARTESTGERNRIHISEELARLLEKGGKTHWVKPREDKVFAKGKGELQTYWLQIRTDATRSTVSGSTESQSTDELGQVPMPEVDEEVAVLAAKSGGRVEGASSNVGSSLLPVVFLPISAKRMRLINWNVELLTQKLEEIVACRQVNGVKIFRLLNCVPWKVSKGMNEYGVGRITRDRLTSDFYRCEHSATTGPNKTG